MLSGAVRQGRPFRHFGGWGWGARVSENSPGYGCRDASRAEADPKRRMASPPPLLGQSICDCPNDGKGASEGRGRSPMASLKKIDRGGASEGRGRSPMAHVKPIDRGNRSPSCLTVRSCFFVRCSSQCPGAQPRLYWLGGQAAELPRLFHDLVCRAKMRICVAAGGCHLLMGAVPVSGIRWFGFSDI